MGFLLSGQDFHPEEEPRNPYEAGIGFVVKLDTEFVGRDVLEGSTPRAPTRNTWDSPSSTAASPDRATR